MVVCPTTCICRVVSEFEHTRQGSAPPHQTGRFFFLWVAMGHMFHLARVSLVLGVVWWLLGFVEFIHTVSSLANPAHGRVKSWQWSDMLLVEGCGLVGGFFRNMRKIHWDSTSEVLGLYEAIAWIGCCMVAIHCMIAHSLMDQPCVFLAQIGVWFWIRLGVATFVHKLLWDMSREVLESLAFDHLEPRTLALAHAHAQDSCLD